MNPLMRRVIKRAILQFDQNSQTNAEARQPSVYLRLRAARTAQVSFVEFEVPNQP